MENDLHVKKNIWNSVDRDEALRQGSVRRIALDLRRHCIQTALKRLFESHMNQYFSSPDTRGEALESLLAALEDILGSWDFAALRSMGQGLEGGRPEVVHLVLPEGATPFLEVSGKRVAPPSRNATGERFLQES